MRWPGKAMCAHDRTRHATARGTRRAAFPSPSLPASPLTRPHRLPRLVLPTFGNGSSDPPSAPPLPPSPTTLPQPPSTPLLSLSSLSFSFLSPNAVDVAAVPRSGSPSSPTQPHFPFLSSPMASSPHRRLLLPPNPTVALRRAFFLTFAHPLSPSLFIVTPTASIIVTLRCSFLFLVPPFPPTVDLLRLDLPANLFSAPSLFLRLHRRSHPSPAIFSSSPSMLLWSPGSSVVTPSRRQPPTSVAEHHHRRFLPLSLRL